MKLKIIHLALYFISAKADLNWTRINYNSNVISPRYFHAGAYFPQTNEYLVFGGNDNQQNHMNDFYSIDLGSNTAVQIYANNYAPLMGREAPSYTSDTVSGDFYVHTGRNKSGMKNIQNYTFDN